MPAKNTYFNINSIFRIPLFLPGRPNDFLLNILNPLELYNLNAPSFLKSASKTTLLQSKSFAS